ncbi:MAG: SDR family oxidoreductase [Actinomycetes bacterium]
MNRIVIVTGGASGIGRALSAEMVRRGDTVIVADIDGEGAHRAALTMSGSGSARAAVLDVRDADAVLALVTSVHDEFGRLDVMVNNAGIGLGGFAEELSVDHWDSVIDVNIRGVVNGVVAAYPVMVRQGHGHIVNTASLAGLVPAPGLTPYAMTKHAVVGLSTSLRVEAAGYGVKVTAVCPGFTDTAILDTPVAPGLAPTSASGRGRELASKLPGGLYDADLLALDIVNGIDRNRRLVIAPRSARVASLANRLIPALVERQVRKGIDAMRGAAVETLASTSR